MTKRPRPRRRDEDETGAPRGLRRDAFPALRAFLRGYLHQDFPEVHGSLRDAAAAFRADASAAERDRLVGELESLADSFASRPARLLRQFVTEDLGSAWSPKSREEVAELLEVLRRE